MVKPRIVKWELHKLVNKINKRNRKMYLIKDNIPCQKEKENLESFIYIKSHARAKEQW